MTYALEELKSVLDEDEILDIELPDAFSDISIFIGSALPIHQDLEEECDAVMMHLMQDFDALAEIAESQIQELASRSARMRNSELIAQLATQEYQLSEADNWTPRLQSAVELHRKRALQRDSIYLEIEGCLLADSNAARFEATRRKQNFEQIFPNYKPPS